MIKKILKKVQEEMGTLEMCRKCYSFRQEGGWHFERAEYFLENDVEEKLVKFIQCPACTEEALSAPLAMYEMEYAS